MGINYPFDKLSPEAIKRLRKMLRRKYTDVKRPILCFNCGYLFVPRRRVGRKAMRSGLVRCEACRIKKRNPIVWT